MEIQINYLAVLVSAILAMVLGMVWYGRSLFGPFWLELMGIDPKDKRKIKDMQKRATPLYVAQLALSLLQLYILAHFIIAWGGNSGVSTAFWIYLGFVMPTLAGQAMWSGRPGHLAMKQFIVTAGYQLLCFLMFGFILGMWG